ncbi:DUF5686 family protein [Porphyromonas pogonae]|uniref:DUF5686 family protein n=1 Tax=Porphyromonas pogonae TaxID=867595 RepID=UPI002E75B5D5|nr:DUF5686 family protein [Porphyromonas pogonae]
MKHKYIISFLIALTTLSLNAHNVPLNDSIKGDNAALKSVVSADTLRPSKRMERFLRYMPEEKFRVIGSYYFLRKIDSSYREREKDPRTDHPMIKGDEAGIWGYLIFGKDYDFKNFRLGVFGLTSVIDEINDDDGWWLGYKIGLSYRFKPGVRLTYIPSIYYTTKSKYINTQHNLSLHYAPRTLAGLLVLSGGITSGDLNYMAAQQTYLNQYPIFPLGNSPVRYYRKEYGLVRNEMFIGNRLQLTLTGTMEKRTPYYKDNSQFEMHKALTGEAQLLFHLSPKVRYSTAGGAKYINPAGYPLPALGVIYRQAFKPKGETSDKWVQYKMIEGIVRGAFPTGKEAFFDYLVTAGKYIDRTYVMQPDEKYFGKNYAITIQPLNYTFATLPNLYTGGNQWVSTQLNYTSQNLLVTQWNKIKKARLDETLHVKALSQIQGMKPYIEGGYSIGYGDLTRMGLFLGYDFERGKPAIAFRLSIPLINLTKKWGERE